jgi:GNAT superfamily N-acetyltransferase
LTHYTVSPAAPEHLDELRAIELRAATRFRTWNVPPTVFAEATALETLSVAQADGLLWVALAADMPVGFALTSVSGARLYVEEIDVAPEHAGQGLGLALLAEVEGCAASRRCTELALTTYRDVPWNAPFYLRHGFELADPSDGELAARLREEASRGLATMPRVALRKAVSRTRGRSG